DFDCRIKVDISFNFFGLYAYVGKEQIAHIVKNERRMICLKIHIVQKGDTLWEIAKKYNVDFEEMKQINSQLSSPDMIMPGMKVKIPSSTKVVKKESKVPKEKQKSHLEHPYKDISPKPLPTIAEDDHKKPKEVKVEKPKMDLSKKQKCPRWKCHKCQCPNYKNTNYRQHQIIIQKYNKNRNFLKERCHYKISK